MAKQNIPLLAFNRGIISPLSLARTDLDRTRLSASLMTNFLPKTQGAMIIRPGTKYRGSSINDTGAYFIEFVARTDDAALLEITKNKMRIWDADTGTISLVSRQSVSATLTISDTGWADASSGGGDNTAPVDLIPEMNAETTGSVTITGSSTSFADHPWKAGDKDVATTWTANVVDTGWLQVDFGVATTKRVKDFSIRAPSSGTSTTPRDFFLQGNHDDTGDFLSWTTEIDVTGQTSWSASEKRTFSDTGWTDTGANLWRYWRIYVTEHNSESNTVKISEIEMFEDSGSSQASFNAQGLILHSAAEGSLAKVTKRVVVSASDTGVEHSLAINVGRGPVTFRCGTSADDDDLVNETRLGTGYHNLAFTPGGVFFHITIQSDNQIDRIVTSINIGDTGTVEITTPWATTDLDNIRYDQSADVVFVNSSGVKQQKIERRGGGRSWSVVDYSPNDGPFFTFRSANAKLKVSRTFGNTILTSNIPFFKAAHVGALFRLYHSGQSGVWKLGGDDAFTDPIRVTGINDTGLNSANSERVVTVSTTGNYTATVNIQRSFDGEDIGFHDTDDVQGTIQSDTGTYTRTIRDKDDNVSVWYRAAIKTGNYTSGVANIAITYDGGNIAGICRVTGYRSNTEVDVEVLRRFSSTTYTKDWQEGFWSSFQGFTDAVALHEGRLGQAGGAQIFMSVSDNFESFDDTIIGESAPIVRVLGSGPVDRTFYLSSLSRLIVGTTGAEISIRSSSLDEALTPENSSARRISTRGSANLRAVEIDQRAIFVQRSGQRVYTVGFGETLSAAGDFESSELTLLVPDLLEQGVVSIAVQRQPDTRLHCVLADGKVAIMTYEPQEQVLAWSLWETDGTVERVMALPGVKEDKVFYHINRTIDGSTKRYLEQWAMESECQGDTGLSWLADCAASYTDTGRSNNPSGFGHLAGESIIGWGSDTGQSVFGKDLSPGGSDTGTQTTFYVNTASDTGDTGKIGLSGLGDGVHHFVGGLPYTADFRSTKMAYAAQGGTALAQFKRSDKIAFILSQTHNSGLHFGSDTGNLDPLPRRIDADTGGAVDKDKIFESFDQASMPFPGLWDTDSRIYLRGKAPRPVTVMAAVPTITTNEK